MIKTYIRIIFLIIFFCMMLVPSLLVAQDEEDPILFQEATLRTKKEYDAYKVKNAPSENSFVAVGLIAGIYIKQKKWQSAVDIYLKYKPLFPDISDKFDDVISILYAKDEVINIERLPDEINIPGFRTYGPCLLYTSDAADERSSVDLGGRRIIKKKIDRNYCADPTK